MPETLHSLILSAAPPFETLQKREASKTAEPHHTRPACVCVGSGSCPLRPHGLQPPRLLCPWDSPGRKTAVGCHGLLWGLFLTQGSNHASHVCFCRRVLYHLPGKSHSWKSLVGYSPWGRKESDTTERLSFSSLPLAPPWEPCLPVQPLYSPGRGRRYRVPPLPGKEKKSLFLSPL